MHSKNQLFIALTETWLHKHKDAEINVDGYSVFRADRKRPGKSKRGRLSGGVAAYIRNDIGNKMEVDLSYSNGVIEILGLYSKADNIYIGVVYRQPNDPTGGNKSGLAEFKSALSKLKQKLDELPTPTPNIIICGDFNLPHCNWESGEPTSGATKDEKEMLSTLKDLSEEFFLKQHITSPTHIAGNTLDLLLTNSHHLLHSYICLEMLRSVSDHHIIEAYTQFKANNPDDEEKPEFVSQLDKYNFFSNDIKWDAINSEFANIDWDEKLQEKTPDEKLGIILEVTEDITSKNVPLKKMRKKCPEIPRDRRILMKKRSKLQIQMSKSFSDARKDKLKKKLIKIEMALQKSIAAAQTYREAKAISAIRTNSKYFFSYAKKFSKTNKSIGPLLNQNNEYTSSSKEMANILANQYGSVFSNPTNKSVHAVQVPSERPLLEDVSFSEVDLINAIDELSNTSSSGPDGVPAILMKKCKKTISRPLYILYRNCLDMGITPADLRLSHIIPIFKGGHQGLAADYRPISLTSHISKIFEKVIRNHLASFLEANNLYNPNQHGFRKGRSCLSQLLAHYDLIIEYLEKGLNVDTIYLDFSKAFDKVNHNIVMDKLEMLGISGKIKRWIHSFLSERYQRVIVNGFLSEPMHVKSGVPQGSVIGPLLFLVLISDIDQNVTSSHTSSFADDTRLLRESLNSLDCTALQSDLDAVFQWSLDNNMTFNDSKFELVRYGTNQELKDSTFYTRPDGEHIEEKYHVRDLGVTMSNTATFTEHINKIADSARDMCSWILRTFKSRSPELMLTTWKSLVLPILDYCSQLWCPTAKGEIQKLEKIQQSLTRKIKLNTPGLSYWDRLKHLRLYSLERRRERYRILYVWKLLENLVPNIASEGKDGFTKLHSARNGVFVRTPSFKTSIPPKVWKLREGSIQYHGAKLFNSLPKEIRGLTGCSLHQFKQSLDAFLSTIQDRPLLQGYPSSSSQSNSLVKLITLSQTGNPSPKYPSQSRIPPGTRW